jgi:hypothetical protein
VPLVLRHLAGRHPLPLLRRRSIPHVRHGLGQERPHHRGLPGPFHDTEDDHNIDRPPTRSLGWSKDGAAVLLSDGWDIWQFPVAGGKGVNLTPEGRKEGVRFRSVLVLDPEAKGTI